MVNYELEEHIIGGILSYPEEYSYALRQACEDDFQGGGAATLFAVCQKQWEKEGKLLLLALPVEEDLRKYARYCMGLFTTRTLFDDYLKVLVKQGRERRFRERVSRMLSEEQESFREELRRLLAEEEQAAENYEEMILEQIVAFSGRIHDAEEQKTRIYTGFPRIDRVLCGLRLGTLSYIGARPGTGKTAFALNILKNQLKNGRKTAFFSLEMSVGQIFERLLSDVMSLNYGRINAGNLKEGERDEMVSRLQEMHDSRKLFVLDDRYSVESILEAIGELRPEFVVVDFIQCVRTSGKFASRRNEIDYISQELKRAAKRYHCHIMVLSQMSRGERGSVKSPKMSDLKESGGLEQDGDYILILHRPYVLDKERFRPEETELNIEKNKYGRTGVGGLCFKGEVQRFVEVPTAR